MLQRIHNASGTTSLALYCRKTKTESGGGEHRPTNKPLENSERREGAARKSELTSACIELYVKGNFNNSGAENKLHFRKVRLCMSDAFIVDLSSRRRVGSAMAHK